MAKETNISTAQELYNFLYKACDIIRGPVSHENFKDYITPLLYFKRLSDVYDEETAVALQESGGDEEYAAFPEQHRFVIPDGCHWSDIRNRTENLGSAIVGAMRQIELANPETLYGVLSIFGTSNWMNKTILDDAKIRDLIEHFSSRKLGNNDYPADLMGDAYEILLKQFADESKKKAGEFYTPRSVVRLLVRILDPQPGESVYDPACGSGGMLIEAIRYMHNDSLCCGAIYGQEKNVTNAAIAKMNLFLHGASDFNVRQGDTLREPKILSGDHLARFHCVLANPPYSIKNWDRAAFQHDAYGRNILGTPPQGRADYAFFQHILASMDKQTGRCAILFPHGVLFRDEEKEMRQKLVEMDKIECIIGMGANLFFNSPMEASIVICRSQKTDARKGKILFINAIKEVVRKNGESYLEDAHIEKIVSAYNNDEDVPFFSKWVRNEDIQDASLNIVQYVQPEEIVTTRQILSVEATEQAWKTQSRDIQANINDLQKLLSL